MYLSKCSNTCSNIYGVWGSEACGIAFAIIESRGIPMDFEDPTTDLIIAGWRGTLERR